MDIKTLIKETGEIKENRSESQVFSKKFGTVYAMNKTVLVDAMRGIISVSMMIGAATEKIGLSGNKKSNTYHKASISFKLEKGKDYEYYTPEALVEKARETFSKYSDEKEWPIPDVLSDILNNPGIFEGATVFKAVHAENKVNGEFNYSYMDIDPEGHGKRGYCIVQNKIPEDTEVQVWCSCSDYYWTMQFYNCENSVDLYGRYPERYIPKTKKGFEAFKKGQPLRNPGRHPGMCKHLMLLMALLMKDNLVQSKDSNLKGYLEVDFDKFEKKDRRLSTNEYDNMIREFKNEQGIKSQQRKLAHDTSYGFKGHNAGWGYKWDAKKGQFVKSPRKKK